MAFTATEFDVLSEKTLLFLIILDKSGKVVKANSRCQSLFGNTKDNLVGKFFQDYLLDEDIPKFKELMQGICETTLTKIQSLRFANTKNTIGILALKFDFVCHNEFIYATGIDTTEENKEHDVLTALSKLTKTGAWHFDPIHNQLYFSKECYRLHDLEPGTSITIEEALSYYPETSRKRIKDYWDNLINFGTEYDYIDQIITEKGIMKWIRVIGKCVKHNNKVIFINGSFSDITEQQNFIEQLKHNEETKNLALKGIRSGLFDHILETNLVFYSTDFRKMLGLPTDRDFVPEETFRKMIHPEDIDEALARHLDNLKKPGHLYYNYYRLKHLNEGYRHYEVYGYRKKDGKGNTVRMIGNLIDVHQKKINEALIAENQNRLFAMINNGFTYSLLLNTQGQIIMADQSTIKIIKRDFGINPKTTLVKFIEVMPLNFKNTFAHEFNEALKGKTIKKEVERTTSKGALQWLEAKYTPIFDQDNEVSSVLVSFHDITELKTAELATKQAHIKEQELSSLKSNILSNFSHEIRTPLNGIMTICNLILGSEKIVEDKNKLLEYLEDSKNRLLETMNSLSHFSEIETIKNNLDYIDADMNYTVETSFREYRHLARSKNLTYTLELDESCPVARIDQALFSTALNNIIHNAIKYTNQGKIKVTLSTESESNDIRISVKDTGIGIKKDNLKTIFDPFVQESIGLSRKYEGTGIGLSLSKRYIEILGGKIKVKSKHKKGTEFIITIPLVI